MVAADERKRLKREKAKKHIEHQRRGDSSSDDDDDDDGDDEDIEDEYGDPAVLWSIPTSSRNPAMGPDQVVPVSRRATPHESAQLCHLRRGPSLKCSRAIVDGDQSSSPPAPTDLSLVGHEAPSQGRGTKDTATTGTVRTRGADGEASRPTLELSGGEDRDVL